MNDPTYVGENDVVKVGQIFTWQQCAGMCAQALKALAAAKNHTSSKRARAKKIEKGLEMKATELLAELRKSGVVREHESEVVASSCSAHSCLSRGRPTPMPAAPTLNATTAHKSQPPGMPPIAVGRFLQLYTVHHFLHGGRRQCPKTSDP